MPGIATRRNARLLRKMPANYEISEAALKRAETVIHADTRGTLRVLDAVSNSTRLRILRALKVKELCVCVFVSLMGYEYSKLSYHLKLLKKAELVESRKNKNFLNYRLTDYGRKVLASIDR